jgi:hypothetical protein
MCLISGFRHEVVLDSWPLKMRPIGCPTMLGRSYHYLLHNNVEGVFQTNMPWQAENLVGYITENSYTMWNSTLWLVMRPSLSFLVQWLYKFITPQNSHNSWKLYNSQSTAQNCWTKYNFIVDKKNQLDVTFCILYFSSNSCSCSASIGRTTYRPDLLDHLPAATAHTNTRL